MCDEPGQARAELQSPLSEEESILVNKPLWFAATLLATSNALGNVEAEIELGIEVRAETGVEVQFMPVLASHRFSVETYQSIWSRYGARIIASLERRTCLPFIEPRVGALVDDATSHSGGRDHPMRLRATYADETKMSTLVHELGHRHLWQLEEGWRMWTATRRFT